MTLFLHEIKMNAKSMIIWTISIVSLCAGCLLLFQTMEEAMGKIAESYSNMGAFTAAFGMDKLSIATIEGFFATEVGTIFSLGGAMFAGLLGIGILAKEEGGHTSEFLGTLPLSRGRIVFSKMMAIIVILLVFDVVSLVAFLLSFAVIGESVATGSILVYMAMQCLMQLEVAGICFAISAASKQNQMGLGIGLTLLFYVLNIISRITEDAKALRFITPVYYGNAADIIGNSGKADVVLVVIGGCVTVVAFVAAFIIYGKKDLAA